MSSKEKPMLVIVTPMALQVPSQRVSTYMYIGVQRRQLSTALDTVWSRKRLRNVSPVLAVDQVHQLKHMNIAARRAYSKVPIRICEEARTERAPLGSPL